VCCTSSDRLRWIAEYVGLAGKALSVVACVEGLEYPPDTHVEAQSDLRDLADFLESQSGAGASITSTHDEMHSLSKAKVALMKAAVHMGGVCKESESSMELMEVCNAIQYALIRLREWNRYADVSPTLIGADDLQIVVQDVLVGHIYPAELSPSAAVLSA